MAFEKPLFVHSEIAVAAIIQYRVVVGSGLGVKMSTGIPSASRPIGVAQETVATTGRTVAIMTAGITKVEASTAALARWVYVSPTSGAASTGSQLGGTVKATTVIGNSMGVALTSAAAAAAGNKRYVSVLLFR